MRDELLGKILHWGGREELLRISHEALELDEKATKGPWKHHYWPPDIWGVSVDDQPVHSSRLGQGIASTRGKGGRTNMQFIESARTNYPKLARALIELLKEVE